MISEELSRVLAQQPLGLVFDIDGTLSPIAPTPEEARLYPGVSELLAEARKYARVAIMTGRAVDDGTALVNVEGLTYIGTHGLEWCDGLPPAHPVHLIPEALAYVEPGKYLLDLVERELSDLPGIIVQRKRVGGSIHYRLAPEPEQAKQRILTLLEEPARRLHMRLGQGKMVVEVLAPLNINKGEALHRFVQRQQLQGVIFAGDDRTDLDAMLEIAKLRQNGMGALAVAVQHSDTLSALLEHADMVVQEVAGMVRLLREIVDSLART
jgi:trehalose 6-phosphate phosphatase